MDTYTLREFVVLAEVKNYCKAAVELAVSESTLSRHIKALESELGVCLLNRTSRSVELSAYGEVFLAYARQFVAMQHRLAQDLKEAQEKEERTIVIGTAYYIDDLLAHFHLYNSRVALTSIHMRESNGELANLLRLGMCDLVFMINPADVAREFIVLPYESDRHVAVLPRAHRLARRTSLALSDLAQEDFVSFKLSSFGDNGIKDLCRHAGFEPRIIFTADSGSAIASFVGKGMGVSILQKKTLTKMHPSGVALVDIEPESSIHVVLCYRRDSKLSAAAESLIAFITHTWPTLKAKDAAAPAPTPAWG